MSRALVAASSRTIRATVPVRPFSISTARHYPNTSSTHANVKTDKDPDDKHAVKKAQQGETANIQEASAKAGMEAHKNGKGAHATEQQDSAGGKAKAKKEFPEAPDVAIGMQDERGGRGG